MPSQLPRFDVGDIVLVRFEIRRAQPSDLGCYLARRGMRPADVPHGWHYDWIPKHDIAGLEREGVNPL